MSKKQAKARVIGNCTIERVNLKPNVLIQADPALLEQAEKDGDIDMSADAVKFCEKTLKVKPLAIEKYVDPAPEGDEE